jgi:hypothetical protein
MRCAGGLDRRSEEMPITRADDIAASRELLGDQVLAQ